MKTHIKDFIKDMALFEISSLFGWYTINLLLLLSGYSDINDILKSFGANMCCYITYHYTYK